MKARVPPEAEGELQDISAEDAEEPGALTGQLAGLKGLHKAVPRWLAGDKAAHDDTEGMLQAEELLAKKRARKKAFAAFEK